jgi:hypothetical protein
MNRRNLFKSLFSLAAASIAAKYIPEFPLPKPTSFKTYTIGQYADYITIRDIYYDKATLNTLRQQTLFNSVWAESKPMPRHEGKTIRFYTYSLGNKND